jgi:hypothetical protein
MIRALAGWMLVAPLAVRQSANDSLRLGRVHSIGELPDPDMQDKIPFKAGDRVAWIDGVGQTFVINETLVAVSLNAPIVYEPADDLGESNGHPGERGDS